MWFKLPLLIPTDCLRTALTVRRTRGSKSHSCACDRRPFLCLRLSGDQNAETDHKALPETGKKDWVRKLRPLPMGRRVRFLKEGGIKDTETWSSCLRACGRPESKQSTWRWGNASWGCRPHFKMQESLSADHHGDNAPSAVQWPLRKDKVPNTWGGQRVGLDEAVAECPVRIFVRNNIWPSPVNSYVGQVFRRRDRESEVTPKLLLKAHNLPGRLLRASICIVYLDCSVSDGDVYYLASRC
jgi:hypothetical protein